MENVFFVEGFYVWMFFEVCVNEGEWVDFWKNLYGCYWECEKNGGSDDGWF